MPLDGEGFAATVKGDVEKKRRQEMGGRQSAAALIIRTLKGTLKGMNENEESWKGVLVKVRGGSRRKG